MGAVTNEMLVAKSTINLILLPENQMRKTTPNDKTTNQKRYFDKMNWLSFAGKRSFMLIAIVRG